jgi:hypothetical protein
MADKRNTAARVGAGPGVVRLNDASLLMLRQVARRVVPGEADGFAQQVTRLHKEVASGGGALAQARAVEERIAADSEDGATDSPTRTCAGSRPD